MKKLSSLFCLFIVSISVQAQNNLTLEQAVALALKNNIGIQVATNQQEMVDLAAHAGNAGMLPLVNASATGSTGSLNSYQEFANGTTQERNNAKSNGINAGITATWVIFDGMRMFATHEKLNELAEMSELELKLQIENTLEQVTVTYYNAERLEEQYHILLSSLSLYQERENLAKLRLETGKGNRTEYLQATVERTTQENVLMQLQLEWKNALVGLHTLLGVTYDSLTSTSDSLTLPSYASGMNAELVSNTEMQLAQKGIGIAQLEKKEIQGSYYPRISIGGGYNFVNSNNQAGFVLLNRNYGYSGLINVSWDIFNGNNTRINSRIAGINIENQELLKKQTELMLQESYYRAYNQYALALQQVKAEQSSEEIATENMNIAMERYREGKSTLIEVREAQKYADDIKIRLVNALYNARIAEVMLKRIKGELVTTTQ